jgi:alkyldihydroxyacetonephosphate synthase
VGAAFGGEVLARLRDACPATTVDDGPRVEAGRDWWPLSAWWAVEGRAAALPGAVCRPVSTEQVAAVVRVCVTEGLAVTPFAGGSGVCGGSIPLHGGVSLDLTGLDGLVWVDDESLLIEVRAGTFGPDLESALRARGLTLGHWPQSFDLSTVGGWLACRSAGQYSTRYGKIEDMVAGMELVTADGSIIRTGGSFPRAAIGPDLTQMFVGSEGTLGIITAACFRVHPLPPAERRAAFGFADFPAGLDACRRILRRGATPAVLRLYDPAESDRQFSVADRAVLVVIDEGDGLLVDAVMRIVEDEAGSAGGAALGDGLAGMWLERRNHLPPLADLVGGGLVVDTVEIAARWSALPGIYKGAVSALRALDGTIVASAHQSHAYPDGACLYFTFAGRPEVATAGGAEAYYRQAFDTITAATGARGGAISHHHGIGLNRSRYLPEQLGPAFGVLQAVKDAVDPGGFLNPGKLGLTDRFGTVEVP